MMEISGKTKLASLLGHPVAHSFSPYIQNYLGEKSGIDMRYMCFDVEEEHLGAAVRGMKAMGFMGSNVTIPHKINVMQYLDEIDENAAIIGAVNTIKNENGKLIGYNTDGVGFVKSVLEAGHILEGKRVVVLGAGGASRAVVVELAVAGVASINIRNNTLEKAEALACQVKAHFDKVQVSTDRLAITAQDLEGVDFLINTTPLGMSKQKDLCPIDENIVPPEGLVVCDIVYTPHDTKLLLWAQAHGLSVVHGIGMLINQAVHSFYLWTGEEVAAYDEILRILREQGVLSQV